MNEWDELNIQMILLQNMEHLKLDLESNLCEEGGYNNFSANSWMKKNL